MENKSSLLLSKWLNWEGLEATFWIISAVLGEPFHNCWGWMFPARVWWLVTHQKEVFPLFCVSFCAGQSMTNQVPAVICPRLLYDIPSPTLLLYCLQTPPAHTAPAGKGTSPSLWGFNEELVSWACLQHFPILLWKMHHLLKEKAWRFLRVMQLCWKRNF